MALVRSSSDGVAIRYVLPVLWMTSFHIMAPWHVTWIRRNDAQSWKFAWVHLRRSSVKALLDGPHLTCY